jgi:hypothetical protein
MMWCPSGAEIIDGAVVSKKDGCWFGESNGYEGFSDFIQGETLGFCCCGLPIGNLMYVLSGLELICFSQNIETVGDWFEKIMGETRRVFPRESDEYFFKYWADKEGLSEHGGGIGSGWLSEKGERLIDDLRILEDLIDSLDSEEENDG